MDAKALRHRLKELLQAEHIRLWEPPYTYGCPAARAIPPDPATVHAAGGLLRCMRGLFCGAMR